MTVIVMAMFPYALLASVLVDPIHGVIARLARATR
jgi:hypothetical protein